MTYEFDKNCTVKLKLTNAATPLKLIWIEPGSFLMGARAGEPGNSPAGGTCFEVKLSTGFWISRCPVTQAQWSAVMKNNPSFNSQGGIECPVESVSWHDAISFCNKLNEEQRQELPQSFQFSLPTEAQWEYACRSGTSSLYATGDTEDSLAEVAWYLGNSNGHTHPVATKAPNGWGIFDMLGNVEEWCFDPYAEYPENDQVDWVGKASPIVRSTRSDCYWSPYGAPDFPNRCSRRGYAAPDDHGKWKGFRICLRQTVLSKK